MLSLSKHDPVYHRVHRAHREKPDPLHGVYPELAEGFRMTTTAPLLFKEGLGVVNINPSQPSPRLRGGIIKCHAESLDGASPGVMLELGGVLC